jgi:hypothetical protein
MSSQQRNLMNMFFTNLKFIAVIALTATNLSLFDRSARAERGCIITDEGATICGSTAPKKSKKQPSQSNGSKKLVGNLLVELKGCYRQDETKITCEFNITNKGERRSLDLFSLFSDMIDSSGQSHKALYSRLGAAGGVLGASLYEAEPDISYAASLTFNDIPQSVNKVQLLAISTKLGSTSGRIQFRNIPVSN